MAKKKDTEQTYNSKADRNREERKEREARVQELRSKNGSKKTAPKRVKRRNNILTAIAAVLVVIVAVIAILWQTGTLHRNLSALTVNGESISVNEYNYSYNNIYNAYNQQYGGGGLLNLNASSSAITNQDKTWGEFFEDSANESVQTLAIVHQQAIEEGYELTEEDQEYIDNYVSMIQQSVGTPLDFEMYLTNMYGKGMSVQAYRDLLAKEIVAGNFSREKPATLEVSDEEIEERYEEAPRDYDLVNYHGFTVTAPSTNEEGEDYTAEELEEIRQETEQEVKDILADVESVEDFEQAAQEYAESQTEDSDEEIEVDTEELVRYPNIVSSNRDLADWLFGEGRQEGNTSYFQNGNTFQLVYFVEQTKDTRNVADLMVAGFSKLDPNGDRITDEMVDTYRDSAEFMTRVISTEEEFTEFENNEDETHEKPTRPSTVIENATGATTSVHSDVINFALSDEAEAGNTYVVETDNFIYVVLVIEKHDHAGYQEDISGVLEMEKYNDWLDETLEDPAYAIEPSYPGWWMKA